MRRIDFALCATVLWACLATACADPDGLGEDEVTKIPSGNATGTELSGPYEMEVRTTDCQGSCSVETEWFTVSICDIGETTTEVVQITQKNGVLEASWAEPLSLLRGGVSRDGSFDMGAFGTESGGDVEISLRVTGTIDATELSAEARSWTNGAVDAGSVDCVGHYKLRAARPTGEPVPAGATCSSDDDCTEGNCNDETKQCPPTGPDDSACGSDDDCAGGNCNFATFLCQPPAPEGAACGADDDCAGGNCNFTTFLCQPPGPEGAACGADDDCAGGNCNFATWTCG